MKIYEHAISIWRVGQGFSKFNKLFNIEFQSMKRDQQVKIRAYLENPQGNPRPLPDEQRHFVYLLTYLGEMFIQGYRIIEKFQDIIVLSLMEFQLSDQLTHPQKRAAKKLPPKYKALLWQYDETNIWGSGAIRKLIFSRMATVTSFFGQVEFNIIYLHTAKYSILNRAELEKGGLPTCKDYYKKIQWIEIKSGFKPLQEKEQGIALHLLAQLFIKGAGEARNLESINRMQSKNKFCYDLFYVVHTVCYVVGKEMLQSDYQTISSQKWMRYTTEKRFKRYDLLLRNEVKSGIIDWKFSKLQAEQKIKGNGVKNKNKQYYQLAYKDFFTDVQLKFYCFHSRVYFCTYHFFTCASYFHKIPVQYIDKMEEVINIEEDEDSENENQPEESNKILLQNQIVEIQEIEVKSSSLSINMEPSKSNQEFIINLDENESLSTEKQNKNRENQPMEKAPQMLITQQNKQVIDTKGNQIVASSVLQEKILAIEMMDGIEEKTGDKDQSVSMQKYTRFQRKIDVKQAKFKEKFIDLTSDTEPKIAIEIIDID